MKIFYATTFDRSEERQILIGAYASEEIAQRELSESLKLFDDDINDADIEALMEEGELELLDAKIYYDSKEVGGNPIKVCLLANYYTDYGGLISLSLFPTESKLTKFCKELAQDDECCEDPDDTEMVNARANEIKKGLLNGKCYYRTMAEDAEELHLSNFVTIKMK